MYSFVLLVIVVVTVSATPGNLGIGLAPGGYGNNGNVGNLAASSIGASTSATSRSAASSVVAAAPVVSVGPSYPVPIANSSQSRLDIINPRALVQQVVSSVPVDVPVGYTEHAVVGYGVANIAAGLNGNDGGYNNGYARISSAAYGNNGGSYTGGYSGYGGRGY